MQLGEGVLLCACCTFIRLSYQTETTTELEESAEPREMKFHGPSRAPGAPSNQVELMKLRMQKKSFTYLDKYQNTTVCVARGAHFRFSFRPT